MAQQAQRRHTRLAQPQHGRRGRIGAAVVDVEDLERAAGERAGDLARERLDVVGLVEYRN